MALRNVQTILNAYYAAETAAVAALNNPQGEIVKYTIDNRTVEIRSFADLEILRRIIASYESQLVANQTVVADFSDS